MSDKKSNKEYIDSDFILIEGNEETNIDGCSVLYCKGESKKVGLYTLLSDPYDNELLKKSGVPDDDTRIAVVHCNPIQKYAKRKNENG